MHSKSNVAFLFAIAFSMLFAGPFADNSFAQIKRYTQPVRTSPAQTPDKQVNQHFYDTFNAIQRRKREAEGKGKREAERRRQAEIQRLKLLGVNGNRGIGITRVGGFAPAVVPSVIVQPNPRTYQQQRPTNKKVTVLPPRVIKNPFFESIESDGSKRQSAFKPMIVPKDTPKVIKTQSSPIAIPKETSEPVHSEPEASPSVTGYFSPTNPVIEIERPEPDRDLDFFNMDYGKSIIQTEPFQISEPEPNPISESTPEPLPTHSIMKKTGFKIESFAPEASRPSAKTPNRGPVSYPLQSTQPRPFTLDQLGNAYGNPIYQNGVFFPNW